MIELKNIYVQYVKEYFSLYNFSYEINSHSIFIGDFFDGTIALMRTISKIDKHYSGNILIDNKNLKAIKDKDLNISYLPQYPVVFKNKNIFNNLYFPLKIKNLKKTDLVNTINNLSLELNKNNMNFNIITILKTKIKHLTLSEQKIISLIRSVIKQPKYVLIENFFEDLNSDYFNLALYLINKLKKSSTIIACEKNLNNIDYFKEFNIIELENGSIKK